MTSGVQRTPKTTSLSPKQKMNNNCNCGMNVSKHSRKPVDFEVLGNGMDDLNGESGVDGTGEAEGEDNVGEDAPEPGSDLGEEAPEQDPGDMRHMKKMMDPCLPTKAEVEDHRLTHLPFRSWCPFCVKGRGVESGHYRAERDKDAIGEVHLDYCFPCGAGIKPRNIHEKASVATGCMTVLVLRDRDTKMMLATVVPRKGTKGEFAARRSAAFCAEIGYTGASLIVKSDQEPAITALVNDIAMRRTPAKTIIEQSPVGSSQSNGIVERAIQSYEGMVRVIKGGLEDRWDAKIPDGHAIFHGYPSIARSC